jgi:hypothetical protein
VGPGPNRLLKKAGLRAKGTGLMAEMRLFLPVALSPQPLALQDALFSILLMPK